MRKVKKTYVVCFFYVLSIILQGSFLFLDWYLGNLPQDYFGISTQSRAAYCAPLDNNRSSSPDGVDWADFSDYLLEEELQDQFEVRYYNEALIPTHRERYASQLRSGNIPSSLS